MTQEAYGDRPSDDVLDYLRTLTNFDRERTHERKNEAASLHIRDSLSERMRLAETATEWLNQL